MQATPRKVLVIELAGLGDNVHLIPALGALRSHWPEAQIHVMANAHVSGIFALTPWIARTWAYPNSPRPGLGGHLALVRKLRAEGFEVAINTNGSDRSSLLTWASGAPLRIARTPADGGPTGWSMLFTHTFTQPHYQEPMYLQKWKFMHAALANLPGEGPGAVPKFNITIDPALRCAAGISPEDEGGYIHISPFTTAVERELPLEQVAALVAGLRVRHPQLRIVLSCSPGKRETSGLDALLKLLPDAPWKVFRGTLDIPALAAVIEKAALAFSGDTGSLHLAMMSATPAVAWFRTHRGEREWIPLDPQYRVLIAAGGARDALHGISTEALLAAASELLEARA